VGELTVKDIRKAQYTSVFFEESDSSDERFYKAKLDFITIDERTQKEKRSRVTYLVQATTIRSAMKNLDEVMRGTMIDYETCALAETKIIDANAQADAIRIAAEAEADANKAISESLTKELIDYTYAQTWNGELPKITGGSNAIVDARDLIDQTE